MRTSPEAKLRENSAVERPSGRSHVGRVLEQKISPGSRLSGRGVGGKNASKRML
jgi:hypothetical protein